MLDQTRRPPGPSPREPIFNVPPAIIGVLAVLLLVQALRQVVPDDWDNQVLLRLSFIPGALTHAVDPSAVIEALRTSAAQGPAGLRQAQVGRYILMNAGAAPWSVLTYGLLHADWTHLGLNGLWLLAFGSPLARRLGSRRFVLFLGAASVAGALAHYLTHPLDLEPVIGASAAVSGCMGAALRFMFQPRPQLAAALGLPDDAGPAAPRRPLQSLRGLMGNRRAMAFLAAWFGANLLFGVGIIAVGPSGTTVAWQAHIGGFVLGLLALPLFDRRPSPAGAPSPGAAPRPDDPTPL